MRIKDLTYKHKTSTPTLQNIPACFEIKTQNLSGNSTKTVNTEVSLNGPSLHVLFQKVQTISWRNLVATGTTILLYIFYLKTKTAILKINSCSALLTCGNGMTKFSHKIKIFWLTFHQPSTEKHNIH